MTITTQTIVNRYNALYSILNNGVVREYKTLTKQEITLIVLILTAESSSGSSTSDASAANQTIQILREAEIRDRLPSALVGGRLAVDIASLSVSVIGTLPAYATTPMFNIGSTNGLALDATQTNGTQKSIVRGGVKGTSTAADITSTIVDVNTQALDVSIKGTSTVSINNFPSSQVVTGTFFQATQPVSLTSTTITGSVAVTGGLTDAQIRFTPLAISGTVSTGLLQGVTDTQLRTTPLPISGTVVSNATLSAETTKVIGTVNVSSGQTIGVTGSFFQTTQPVSLVSLPSLPTGTNSIGSISNTTFAATQSGSWNLNNIAGSITLPTGAATSSLQGTGNTSLSSIDGKLPGTLGAKTAAASLAVTLSTDGAFGTNFGLVTDTVATTDTGSFNLISLIKRLLSITLTKGQQLMTASIPVTIASNQSTLSTFTQGSTAFSLISNANTVGTGSGVNFVNALQKYSIQLQVVSGTLTAITVEIQISLTNSGWQTISIFTDIVDGSFIFLADYPALFMRINIITITGTSPVVNYFMVGTI